MKNLDELNKITPLAELLGEDRAEKVKDRIADLIVDRIKSDLDEWDKYIFYPPDYEDILDEAFEKIQKKAVKLYGDAILEKVKQDAEKIVKGE